MQAIEVILQYLNQNDKKDFSIRNISENTHISMRVTKNVLLQLEKFNQVERIVEKNQLLPKWRITKFGKKVLSQVKGFHESIETYGEDEDLLQDIDIPNDVNMILRQLKQTQELIVQLLTGIQIELSKNLGAVLTSDDPHFEEVLSILINKVKRYKQIISNLPHDPLINTKVKKKGNKQKKISKNQARSILAEALFLNFIIMNQIKKINNQILILSNRIENNEMRLAFGMAKKIKIEFRRLDILIQGRSSISLGNHILNKEQLTQLLKNNINSRLLTNLRQNPIVEKEDVEILKEAILQVYNDLKGSTPNNNTGLEPIEEQPSFIPLYIFYQRVQDLRPELIFPIEQLEYLINELTDDGYLPGIKEMQIDDNQILKVVQLEAHDLSKDENTIISHALKLQKFNLTDMIKMTDWNGEKILKILNSLTKMGILKHSKSFLHGDRWYIVSENYSSDK
ncbi:MAG: hypothetical protein ACTSQS_06950 [Promethearchaeota archaeon]